MTTLLNDVRATTFEAILGAQLQAAHAAKPERYRWSASEAPAMAQRMMQVVRDSGVNALDIKGVSLAATMKALQIKPTYKALKDYLTGGNAYKS